MPTLKKPGRKKAETSEEEREFILEIHERHKLGPTALEKKIEERFFGLVEAKKKKFFKDMDELMEWYMAKAVLWTAASGIRGQNYDKPHMSLDFHLGESPPLVERLGSTMQKHPKKLSGESFRRKRYSSMGRWIVEMYSQRHNLLN